MDETKLFKSLNTDFINALHTIYTDDTTHKQIDALNVLGQKLADNTNDPYLKDLLALQIQLEEANLCFKFRKSVKMTSLYKSIMIADAMSDDDMKNEHVSNLAHVVNTNKDLRIRCIEECISQHVKLPNVKN